MANSEHLTMLSRGVAVWNRWRQENPHLVLDLGEAKLSGADLSWAHLRWANGLTQEQVDTANGNSATELPDNLHRPDWRGKNV